MQRGEQMIELSIYRGYLLLFAPTLIFILKKINKSYMIVLKTFSKTYRHFNNNM